MRVLTSFVVMLGLLGGAAATPGSFRGVVVDSGEQNVPGWIFVQGRNNLARRVNVSAARVTYDETVPPASRRSESPPVFAPGTEVRVLAEQDEAGEWRAMEVEVLSVPETQGHGKKRVAITTTGP